MVELLYCIVFSFLCGLFGRMGGAKGYNTKFRDMGIPAVCCLYAFILGVHSWWLILTFGLMFAALTTYWDEVFGYDNFYFHGFMIGLSFAPIMWGNWLDLIFITFACCFWMGTWSMIVENVVWEEFGRYAALPVIGGFLWVIR